LQTFIFFGQPGSSALNYVKVAGGRNKKPKLNWGEKKKMPREGKVKTA